MGRMALLQHTLADGTSHFDWLIERPDPRAPRTQVRERDPNECCLITFRVGTRIEQPGAAAFVAERGEDHRYLYLGYEGRIAGERGSVVRVAGGVVRLVRELDANTISVQGRWASQDEFVWAGHREGATWSFVRGPTRIKVRDPHEREIKDFGFEIDG